MKSIIEITKSIKGKTKNIPLDIKLFFVFSCLITLASWYLELDANKSLRELTIPYTGWQFGMHYDFSVFFIPLGLLTFKKPNNTIVFLRLFLVSGMLLQLIDGFQDWFSITPEDYISTNPYLRYDKMRPIYTIILPLFWVLVIIGSLLNSYLKKKNQVRVDSFIN